MASLWDVYEQLTEVDGELEKAAAQEAVEEFIGSDGPTDDLLKMAAEYDAAGRIMARSFMEEMIKSAMFGKDDEGDKKKGKGKEDEDDEEDDDEDEEDKSKKKKKGLPPAFAQALAEKKAAYLQAMQNDPEYAQRLIAHFTETE